jgi:hypothetical protein
LLEPILPGKDCLKPAIGDYYIGRLTSKPVLEKFNKGCTLRKT